MSLSSEPVVRKKIKRSIGTLHHGTKLHAKQVLTKHCANGFLSKVCNEQVFAERDICKANRQAIFRNLPFSASLVLHIQQNHRLPPSYSLLFKMPPIRWCNKIGGYFLCPSPQGGKAHFAHCHDVSQLGSYRKLPPSQTTQNIFLPETKVLWTEKKCIILGVFSRNTSHNLGNISQLPPNLLAFGKGYLFL